MNLYDRVILPRLLAAVMAQKHLVPIRQRLAAEAEGRVLELGIGSGLNLPFYGAAVRAVVGVDPSPVLLRLAADRALRAGRAVELVEGPAERLPFETGSFDTVVTTWTLCTIGDPVAALREARRVLAPGGRLLFAEHGLSPDAGVARWQNRINPVWKRIAGGCNANRPIPRLLEQAGLAPRALQAGYLPGPRPLTYMFTGSAA